MKYWKSSVGMTSGWQENLNANDVKNIRRSCVVRLHLDSSQMGCIQIMPKNMVTILIVPFNGHQKTMMNFSIRCVLLSA